LVIDGVAFGGTFAAETVVDAGLAILAEVDACDFCTEVLAFDGAAFGETLAADTEVDAGLAILVEVDACDFCTEVLALAGVAFETTEVFGCGFVFFLLAVF
jgi:hypothetical protein